jgi:hypothetical protein
VTLLQNGVYGAVVTLLQNGVYGAVVTLFQSTFCIDVTFEIRTAFYGIGLFNDKSKVIARVFISKCKEGETEKERV